VVRARAVRLRFNRDSDCVGFSGSGRVGVLGFLWDWTHDRRAS
jgi:hypothetical protein